MKTTFLLFVCMFVQIAYSQDINLSTTYLEIRMVHKRYFMDGLSTIASICSDKIEIRKVNSDMIGNRKDTSLVSVITDKDSVARVKNLITDLFIENNTPVILSKIDRDENLVIADYYPAAFSLYIPKTKTREFRLIAAYSYDRMRYVFSKEFVELIDMLNMRR